MNEYPVHPALTGILPWNGRNTSPWISGIGIHTGQPARARFVSTPGKAVRFRCKNGEIPALAECVVASKLCTTLGTNYGRLMTVEHLLAALYILGHFSGFAIEVEGDELPILDGSALGWAIVLRELEPEPADMLALNTSLELQEGITLIEAKPSEAPTLDVTVSYPHPHIGNQHWVGEHSCWSTLLNARTFATSKDTANLRALGYGRGWNGQNAVLYEDTGPNLELRGEDEVVRHKALDCLGDLYLIGRPLHAKITAKCASHTAHTKFALLVRQRHCVLSYS